MKKILLIVGVDPGTTIGYAALNLDCKLIAQGSSRLMDLNKLIKFISEQGLAVIVASDKRNVPGFVNKLATKLGARLMVPRKDMMVSEKKILTRNFITRNDHERDALAAGIGAFKKVKSLLEKIDRIIKDNNYENIGDQLKRRVLIDRTISIKKTAENLNKPDIKKSRQKIKPIQIFSQDYLELSGKFMKMKREFELVLAHRNKIREELKKTRISPKPQVINLNKKMKDSLTNKDRKLCAQGNEIKRLKTAIESSKTEQIRIQKILQDIEKFQMIKIMADVGKNFDQNAKQLNLKKTDIVFIENPDIYSQQSIRKLKSLIDVILSSKKTKWMSDLIVLHPKNLNIKRIGAIGVVRKNVLQRHINKKDLLKKIIKEYKKEK